MSINRVGHILAQQPMREGQQKAAKLLLQVLAGGASRLIGDFKQQHPGEQCYLVVLDTREPIVRDLIKWIRPDMVDLLPQAEAQAITDAGGKQPDVALWVQAIPRTAGIEVARFLAKDEPGVQARCDGLQEAEAVGICLAYAGMVMTPLECPAPGADLGAAERERRAARSRRAGR